MSFNLLLMPASDTRMSGYWAALQAGVMLLILGFTPTTSPPRKMRTATFGWLSASFQIHKKIAIKNCTLIKMNHGCYLRLFFVMNYKITKNCATYRSRNISVPSGGSSPVSRYTTKSIKNSPYFEVVITCAPLQMSFRHTKK